jgi:hypothetical protein
MQSREALVGLITALDGIKTKLMRPRDVHAGCFADLSALDAIDI